MVDFSIFRKARKYLGVTQAELAEAFGCSSATIWYIEHGARNQVSTRTIAKLAEFLDLDATELIEECKRQDEERKNMPKKIRNMPARCIETGKIYQNRFEIIADISLGFKKKQIKNIYGYIRGRYPMKSNYHFEFINPEDYITGYEGKTIVRKKRKKREKLKELIKQRMEQNKQDQKAQQNQQNKQNQQDKAENVVPMNKAVDTVKDYTAATTDKKAPTNIRDVVYVIDAVRRLTETMMNVKKTAAKDEKLMNTTETLNATAIMDMTNMTNTTDMTDMMKMMKTLNKKMDILIGIVKTVKLFHNNLFDDEAVSSSNEF